MPDLPAELFAHWPPELLADWERHRLPSLHDLLIAQERLAGEVRRQNQELRRLADAAAQPSPVDTGARLLALADDLRAAAADQRRKTLRGLIEATDSAERHSLALDEDRGRILAALPKRHWLGWTLPGREALARSLDASCDGARLLVQRLHHELDELGAMRLAPDPGDAFDPSCMRCTGRAVGAAGQIIVLERDGWRLDDTVIRPADVLVGGDPS